MNSTIYIRKENESRWENITDKSAWVNAMLEKSPPNSKVIAEQLEPPAEEIKGDDLWPTTNEKPDIKPKEAVASASRGSESATPKNSNDVEFCKHNAVKGMCKKGCK